MTVQPNTHTAKVRRLITAERSRVFRAFSTATALQQWFSPNADITVEILQFEFVVGGRYRFRYSMLDGSQPVLGGIYDLIQPPEKLGFTWVWEAPDAHAGIPTRVQIELLERDAGTELVLVHTQISSAEMALRHAAGWEATLDQLAGSIASGEGLQRTKTET